MPSVAPRSGWGYQVSSTLPSSAEVVAMPTPQAGRGSVGAASVTADTVFAFMFDPAYYLWNENMGMTVKRYTDEDTDDEVTKAIEIADGACADVNSLVTLTKKKA